MNNVEVTDRINQLERQLAYLRSLVEHPTTVQESPAEGFMTLTQALEKLVDDAGSQADLSRETGLDPTYLSRLINGGKDNPSDETLESLHLRRFVRVGYIFRDKTF